MWTAVEPDDAILVDLLVLNDDDAIALHDLDVVVVDVRAHGQRLLVPDQTAFHERPVGCSISSGMAGLRSLVLVGRGRGALGAKGCARQLPVRWIEDQRRATAGQ